MKPPPAVASSHSRCPGPVALSEKASESSAKLALALEASWITKEHSEPEHSPAAEPVPLRLTWWAPVSWSALTLIVWP